MSNFFNLESPIFQWLSKFADRMILNVIFVISCIPVVTIGAANVALYDVTRRIENDDGRVWRSYWKAFRSNFKQATIIWLVLLVSGLIIGFSALYYLESGQSGGSIGFLIVAGVFFLWAITAAWAFPLQSRFENTVKNTFKLSLVCGLAGFLKSVIAAFINLLPLIIFLLYPGIFLYLIFVWLMIWFSAAASINMRIFKKRFEELEKLSACS